MTGERDPVFIVGTPRSGTTLTARLLGNLPDLFIPGETHFFDDICRDRKTIDRPLRAETRKQVLERLRTSYGRFGETEDQNRVDRLASDGSLDAALSACPTYRDLFATFMQLQAAQSGKPRWGNHVPKDAFELDTILHLFPGARLIGCIRDPRDFLCPTGTTGGQ